MVTIKKHNNNNNVNNNNNNNQLLLVLFCVTRTRTNLSVDDLVSAQRARLSEAFPAHFTHERPRARVNGHVAGQVVVRVEHLSKKNRKQSISRKMKEK